MSIEKVRRYTSLDMERMARMLHYTGTDEFSDEAAQMLAQAAQNKSQVMGLVEAAEKVGLAFSKDSLPYVKGLSELREALSKFRGE